MGNSLRNKLVRLMTHIDTDVKHCAAEFLFVLCKESGELQGLVVGFGDRESWSSASGQARERGMVTLCSQQELLSSLGPDRLSREKWRVSKCSLGRSCLSCQR